MKKTFKRETAWFLTALLGYAIYSGNEGMVEVIIWPILMFSATALGMDWASKQTDLIKDKYEEKSKN